MRRAFGRNSFQTKSMMISGMTHSQLEVHSHVMQMKLHIFHLARLSHQTHTLQGGLDTEEEEQEGCECMGEGLRLRFLQDWMEETHRQLVLLSNGVPFRNTAVDDPLRRSKTDS
ncbi:hypothetical protein MHYP_G00265850 [Metynnis hypsauchen]